MKPYFVFLSIILSIGAFSQQNSLNDFNLERQKISKKGLLVISSYSAANIIYGAIAQGNASGSTKYFHRMNIIWNSITLGITGLGSIAAKKEGTLSFSESLRKQGQAEKLFLFNAGLDLAYVAGGAYLKERSKRSDGNPQKRKGYGESIMLQGGVLFLFDGIMYLIHNKHGKSLSLISEKINLTGVPNGIGLTVKL